MPGTLGVRAYAGFNFGLLIVELLSIYIHDLTTAKDVTVALMYEGLDDFNSSN